MVIRASPSLLNTRHLLPRLPPGSGRAGSQLRPAGFLRYVETLRLRGGEIRRAVHRTFPQHRPRNSDELVCDCTNRDIDVHAAHELVDPVAERVAVMGPYPNHRSRAVDDETSQVHLAGISQAEQPWLATSGVFDAAPARSKPQGRALVGS